MPSQMGVCSRVEAPAEPEPVQTPSEPEAFEGEGWRAVLTRTCFPSAPDGVSAWGVGFVVLLAAALSCVRGGFDLGKATLWAEDGTVFLQGAYNDGPQAFFTPYRGYLLTLPRLIAAVSAQLPLVTQAAAIALGAALVQGLVAGIAYLVIRAQRSDIWPALFVAAAIAMVPVGPEVIRNVANLQWFLLYGAILGQFWTPRTRYGWWVSGAFLFATTTSSPFGFVPAALAMARCVVQRRRATFTIAAAGLLGVAAQLLAMRQSTRAISHDFHLDLVTNGFLQQVVADGVLGTGRNTAGPSSSIVPGAMLVLLVCGLVALLVRQHELDQTIAPALLISAAWTTYVIPAVLTSGAGVSAFVAGRYCVAPALLWLTALVMLAASVIQGGGQPRLSHRVPAVPIALVLLGCMAIGLVTSFHPLKTYGRELVLPWTSQIDSAAKRCAGLPESTPIGISIAPPGWSMTLTCKQLRE
jgi:hypothetical protein